MMQTGKLAACDSFPEEAVGRHQYPARPEGLTEHRLDGRRLDIGIDGVRRGREILRPRWNEAPTGQDDRAPAIGFLPDDRHGRARRDVEPGREVVRPIVNAETLAQPRMGTMKRVASAHALSLLYLPRAATLRLPSPGRQFIDCGRRGFRRFGLGYVIGGK